MEKIFEITARFLSAFFHTGYIVFFQLTPGRDELILKYASGFHSDSLKNLRQISPTFGIFHSLIEKRTSQIENEIFKDEQKLRSLVKLDGLESMIGAPIFIKGELWGILVVFSQQRYKFKKEDRELLNLWGSQIGELEELFSSFFQARKGGNSVQILGNIERLKFRLRKEGSIPASDMVEVLDSLEDFILEGSQDLDRFGEKPIFKEKPEEKSPQGTYSEEVINIEGEKDAPTKKRKVLIVDDQPIITDLLVEILKDMGYGYEVALGGEEGLKLFAKNGFDLVITDLGMPDISGWEVSRSVKKQNPSLPVILITGWGVDPDPHKVKDSGVDLVINKPFQLNQLEGIIKRMINRREMMA